MNGKARLAMAVAAVAVLSGGTALAKDGMAGKVATSAATAAPKAGKASPAQRRQVERGAYLAQVAGCGDCHTPLRFDEKAGMPVPMMERRYSGHPEGAPGPSGTVAGHDMGVIGPTFTSFRLPFGVVYAANLTPDVETGIGGWKAADFVKAFRTGKHMGKGRAVLPPMPWANLAQATDEDLEAMFAFFQSLPAVRNRVPDNEVHPTVYAKQEQTNGMIIQTMGHKPQR